MVDIRGGDFTRSLLWFPSRGSPARARGGGGGGKTTSLYCYSNLNGNSILRSRHALVVFAHVCRWALDVIPRVLSLTEFSCGA